MRILRLLLRLRGTEFLGAADLIDENGYRANVGMILTNGAGRVLLAGRAGQDGWQFPQGGMRAGEPLEESMYRELREELGLEREHVSILGVTRDWLSYRLPDRYVRRDSLPLCLGQKQRWFALLLRDATGHVRFDITSAPEFDRWRWAEYWEPVREVIHFKRGVYVSALRELASTIVPGGAPREPAWPAEWRIDDPPSGAQSA